MRRDGGAVFRSDVRPASTATRSCGQARRERVRRLDEIARTSRGSTWRARNGPSRPKWLRFPAHRVGKVKKFELRDAMRKGAKRRLSAARGRSDG